LSDINVWLYRNFSDNISVRTFEKACLRECIPNHLGHGKEEAPLVVEDVSEVEGLLF
jgi:hypothetical protein